MLTIPVTGLGRQLEKAMVQVDSPMHGQEQYSAPCGIGFLIIVPFQLHICPLLCEGQGLVTAAGEKELGKTPVVTELPSTWMTSL